jgi:hypothetical protein
VNIRRIKTRHCPSSARDTKKPLAFKNLRG